MLCQVLLRFHLEIDNNLVLLDEIIADKIYRSRQVIDIYPVGLAQGEFETKM